MSSLRYELQLVRVLSIVLIVVPAVIILAGVIVFALTGSVAVLVASTVPQTLFLVLGIVLFVRRSTASQTLAATDWGRRLTIMFTKKPIDG